MAAYYNSRALANDKVKHDPDIVAVSAYTDDKTHLY